jgi:hypothetical protein
MDNTLDTLDTLTTAASAEALPLELLQPLDSSNPVSTPVRLSGPEQRLTVTPDPGVRDGDSDSAWQPPSQLLISKDGVTRAIWPVHLAGWQALGWELQPDSTAPAPEPEPEQPDPDPEPAPAGEPEAEPALELPMEQESPGTTEPEPSVVVLTNSGEALLATEQPDFQAMTKAQIIDYCSAVHGVELDGSQTKAELIEQATALEASGSGTAAEDLAALELGDALL